MNNQTQLTPIVFKNIFTKQECEYIKNIVKSEDYIPATVEGENREHILNTQDRKVLNQSIPNLEKYNWIYKRIFLCVNKANQKFNFEITGHDLNEILILKYGIGDFYRKHKDVGGGDAARRRLSVIVQLSDKENYEGCELKFEKGNLTAPKDIGSIIIFPSCLTHEVTELETGERYALVSWFKKNKKVVK